MPNEPTEQTPTKEAEVSLSAKGSPGKVKEGLDEITGGGPEGAKNNGAPGTINVTSAMANPMNVVKVRRIAPTEDQYGRKFQNYFELPCPQTRMNIEEHTREGFGGKNWHVDVVDEEGFRITGYNFSVHELPKLIFEDKSRFGQSMGMQGMMPGMDPMSMGNPMAMGQGWPSLTGKDTGLDELDGIQLPQEEEEEPLEKWLERRTKRRIMMRDVEEMAAAGGNEEKKDTAEDGLAAVLEKITANTDKQVAAMQEATNQQIDALKETMKDEQRRRDQKDTEDKHSQALKDQAERFERQLAELKADKGKSPEMTMLEVMAAMKDDGKLFKIMADMNSSSQENFKEAISLFTQNKPENALETVNQVMGAFGNMAQTFGFGKGDEDLPFESRLLKTVNDVTPEVLKFLREERAKGRELTKEIVEEKIEEVTSGAMNDVKSEVRKAIAEQATKLMGDGGALPQQPAAPAKPKPKAEVPPQPQQPAQKEASEQLANMFNVADDIAGRVNQALIIAGREMQIRPADAQWIDFVYENFPEEIIAALANAKDPRTFFGIMGKYADKKILNHVVQIIIKDAKARAWMKEKAEEFKQGYLQAVTGQEGEQPPDAAPAAAGPQQTQPEEFVDPHAGMAIDPSMGGETPVVFDALGAETPMAARKKTAAATQPPAGGVSGPLGSLPQAEVTQPKGAGPLGGLEQASPPSATPGPGPLGNLEQVAPEAPPLKPAPKKAATKKASKKKASKKKAQKKTSRAEGSK